MKPISTTRIVIILMVTVLSLVMTLPTVRYYLHLTVQPTPKSKRPFADANRPQPSQTVELKEWEGRNPAAAQWIKDNPEYVKWEQESDRLLASAIPLGLDLLGGVDVTLTLDREKTIQNKTVSLKESIQRDRDLEAQKLSIHFIDGSDPTKITIKVDNPADAQTIANLINKNYRGTMDRELKAEELVQGATFGLDPSTVSQELDKDLGGAKKAIAERVNSLGVTQPKISTQGGNRIRVQVPGEKDPDRLIRNVIQPAQLEFRMVAEGYEQFIGPDGKVRADAVLPPGTEVKHGKLGHPDPNDSTQIVYSTPDFVLMKNAELTGKDLRGAGVTQNPSDLQNMIQVSLDFKKEGARTFGEMTKKYAAKTPQRQMAILLDGVVRSAPTLEVPITDGRAVIRGGFSYEEATELSQVLKAGSLPAPLKIMSKRTVGATLGIESIKDGVRALVWGTVVIAIFMICYYGVAGVISIIALVLNVLMVLAIMAMSKATLTLSGIGGIMLTIGMAVDANVLIYERIREELANGRPLRQAIGMGSHRAFAVIIDSHITTLITSLVLLQFTEGSVFGFALTMTFGLLANLYTGLTVTYALCWLWFSWKGTLSLGKLSIFHDTKFDFIGARWISIGASNAVLFIALFLVFMRGGVPLGVDFAGGVSADVAFSKPTEEAQVRDAFKGIEISSVTKVVDQKDTYIIDMPLLAAPGSKDGDTSTTEKVMFGALDEAFPEAYTVVQVDNFGAQVGQEFTMLALTVVLLASFAIMLYLWFRFELVFGVAAVVALLHDLLIVTLLCILWGVKISLDEVAALMILLGFSVNDTIVIFDRIRENTRTITGKSFKEICNLAMNKSLSRTIITSGTVFFASSMLLIFGGPGLHSFAKIITLGAILGTYSSDFIAAPLVWIWNNYQGNRVQEHLSEKRKQKVEAAKPIRSAERKSESAKKDKTDKPTKVG